MAIHKDDYIQGKEHYGQSIREVKGWVDTIRNDGEFFYYHVQADDEWKGARGTVIFSELGKIEKLDSIERPNK